MEEQKNAAIELRNITKTFGKVVANKNCLLYTSPSPRD